MNQIDQQVNNNNNNQSTLTNESGQITVYYTISTIQLVIEKISIEININNSFWQLAQSIKEDIIAKEKSDYLKHPIQFQFQREILKEDDNRSLTQIGINNGSIIDVKINQLEPESSEITLEIKIKGQQLSFPITISSQESIRYLIQTIKIKVLELSFAIKTEYNWSYLINNIILWENDDRSLKMAGITNNTKIEVRSQKKTITVTQIIDPIQEKIKIIVKFQNLPIEQKQLDLYIKFDSSYSELKQIIKELILVSYKDIQKNILEQLQYSVKGTILNDNDPRKLNQIGIEENSIIDVLAPEIQLSQDQIRVTVRMQSQNSASTVVTLEIDKKTPFNILMMSLKESFPTQIFSNLYSGTDYEINESKISRDDMELPLNQLNIEMGTIIDVKFDIFKKKILKYDLIENQSSQIQINFRILGDNLSYPFQIQISDDVTLDFLNQEVKKIISNFNIQQIESSLFQDLEIRSDDKKTIKELGFRHGSYVNLTLENVKKQ